MRKMSETVKENTFDIEHALDILKRGGTIVFPTETLYGLGALSTNKIAVEKVYQIKRRPKEKLLPVIVGSMEQVQEYFSLGRDDIKLAKKFWPGPLSLILRTKSNKLIDALGNDLLAVRLSANPLAVKLSLHSGAPLISTSANISGRPGCFTIAAVKRQLASLKRPEQPDLFIDGGALNKSQPSTIVRTNKGKLSLIREGKIQFKEIVEALKS